LCPTSQLNRAYIFIFGSHTFPSNCTLPRCAHCKSLEPVVSEVGRHYLEDPNFMLYRIDGTKNDVLHQGTHILEFQTARLLPPTNATCRYFIFILHHTYTLTH